METTYEKRLAARLRCRPETGFNVVAVDDYEEAGDELYVVANYDDRESAEAHAKSHTEETGEKAYVYGSDA